MSEENKVKMSDRFEITALELHLLLVLTEHDIQACDIVDRVLERKVKK